MPAAAAPLLHAVERRGDGPAVVLLHGFTQTGVSWDPILDRLAPDLRVVRVDLPGHGGSAHVAADLPHAADLLAQTSAALGLEQALWVGYSMGARHALRLALDRPSALAALVVLGATAGIDDATGRAERCAADAELADRIEREGVEAFLPTWLAMPMFAALEVAPRDLAARLANPAAGLASSLRLAGTGSMDPPWWDELAGMRVPTTVTWGADDAKFAAIGERLVDAIGGAATGVAVDGAGHAAHLERPDAFAELIEAQARRLRG